MRILKEDCRKLIDGTSAQAGSVSSAKHMPGVHFPLFCLNCNIRILHYIENKIVI